MVSMAMRRLTKTRERSEEAAEFDVWLGKILQTFNVLPMDADMFRVVGQARTSKNRTNCMRMP